MTCCVTPGTEIGFALGLGRPVAGIGSWDLVDVTQVSTPQEAVERVERKLVQ